MLTKQQRQAVENFDDNILLLARAGSGKTFTVANKIAEGIRRGISPERMLCLTFTVKAAEELRDEAEKFCGDKGVKVYTVHGFCHHILKEYAKASGEFRVPDVADEVDSGEIIKSLLFSATEKGDYSPPDGVSPLPDKQLYKIFSAIKHRRDELGFDKFSIGGYSAATDSLFKESKFKELFSTKKFSAKITDYDLIDLLKTKADEYAAKYDEILRYSDLVDFDDLILYAKALISKRGAVKNEYDLIIVDEMQDTSLTEYSVIRPLFFGARVMMCGDDFQTIYGWRGSDPEKIKKDFISSFKAVEITLDGNRRSSPLLSYAGSYYLAKAFGYKNPDNRLIDGFDKIDIVACADEDVEAEEVFRRLSEYKGEPSGIAVMARSNRYIAELFRRLVRINASLGESERLGFFTADNDCQFYKKPVIKDFLAYLKITVNKYDFPSFERLAEKYLPSVGRGLLGAIRDYGKEGVSPSGFLCEDAYGYGDEYYSLIEAYKNNGIVVYDLETTGLDTENDDFLQISALKMGKDGEKGQMNIFVMPLAEISPEAIETHGYGKEELQKRGAVSAKTALIRFKEFADGCVLIGHNSYAFDDNILFRTAKREGVELGLGERYDTLSIARLFRPDLADYKLSTLCGEFGVVNERAHDAFSDVTATAAILKVLISDYLIPTAAARTAFMKKHSDKFRAFYENVKTLSVYIGQSRAFDAVKFIGGDCGVMKKHSSAADKESANDFYLALKEVLSGAKEGFSGVKDFVSAAALSGSQMDIVIKKLGKFPLITVHQSKGCEFESVILVGAGENEFPSYGAKVSGNEEEEKRVFYVALSRAKKKLTITYSETKNFGDKSYERFASPYLKYLPENCVEKSEAK